jgi:DNA-binding phage protein
MTAAVGQALAQPLQIGDGDSVRGAHVAQMVEALRRRRHVQELAQDSGVQVQGSDLLLLQPLRQRTTPPCRAGG